MTEAKDDVIKHLEAAIEAHQRGLSLFSGNDYSLIPSDKEEEIMNCCSKCGKKFKALRENINPAYRNVYQTFYDGGMETDCRIGKNRWCNDSSEFINIFIAPVLKKVR